MPLIGKSISTAVEIASQPISTTLTTATIESVLPTNDLECALGNKGTDCSVFGILAEGYIDSTTDKTITPSMDVLSFDTIFPAAGNDIQIVSTSANDAAAGTGARTILIFYLDSTGAEGTIVLNLNGTTPVNASDGLVGATSDVLSINRVIVSAAGSLGWNDGTIYLSSSTETFTAGVPDSEYYCEIPPNHNVNKTAQYTVPLGKKAVLTKIISSSDTTSGVPTTLGLRLRTSRTGPWLRTLNMLQADKLENFDPKGSGSFTAGYDIKFGGAKTGVVGNNTHVSIGLIIKDA